MIEKERLEELIEEISDLKRTIPQIYYSGIEDDEGINWGNIYEWFVTAYYELEKTKEYLKEIQREREDLVEKKTNNSNSNLRRKIKNIEELKQRLKDIIKIYSNDFVEKDKVLKELRFQARNILPLVENLEDKVNQDKIAFAVEQLEKVKKQLRQDVNITVPISELKKLKDYLISVDDFIDNQIKQLKEGK